MHDALTHPLAIPMPFRRCGGSGLHLSVLGLDMSAALQDPRPLSPCLIGEALDLSVTHMDVTTCGASGFAAGQDRIGQLFAPWHSRRDQMVVSARIGLGTQPGPLAGFGSRKQILSGLDGLLRRTGLDYLDLLYAHRFDSTTPVEETASALASAVQQGKALYIGLSSFAPAPLSHISTLLKAMGSPVAAYQAPYSLLNRWVEDFLLGVLKRHRLGCVAIDPGNHRQLRAARRPYTEGAQPSRPPARRAEQIAAARGQSMDQLGVSWVLRDEAVTSVLIPAAHPYHLATYWDAVHRTCFTPSEIAELDVHYPATRTQTGATSPDAISPREVGTA
ncbi:aldo/keto reductase [Streptomyces sp. NPDC005533]|uniref:aldo/keto reductase n=1 Tax=Streptomyces sp. NPDC005533 TaxID=3364723 RepID=UPI0036982641